ncbi:MAG: succinate dehydrogenase iron-sulfur subunit [Phycisphaerales bacterium]
MIAPNTPTKTFHVKVKRQDAPDKPSYWETFEVVFRPQMNVISALQAIAANPVTIEGKKTTPVVWDCNCLEEVCGACTMVMNGRVGQSCSTIVENLLKQGDTLTLEPMSKFPVVRDLFVDRSRLFNNLKEIKGWVPIDGTYSLGPGPKESPEVADLRYNLSRCMSCGCCLEVCPQYTADNHFAGAAVISQVAYFNLHNTGKVLASDRLDIMADAGGVNDCGNAQNCVKICPKEIPLTESIARVGRQTTVHAIKQFFTGK